MQFTITWTTQGALAVITQNVNSLSSWALCWLLLATFSFGQFVRIIPLPTGSCPSKTVQELFSKLSVWSRLLSLIFPRWERWIRVRSKNWKIIPMASISLIKSVTFIQEAATEPLFYVFSPILGTKDTKLSKILFCCSSKRAQRHLSTHRRNSSQKRNPQALTRAVEFYPYPLSFIPLHVFLPGPLFSRPPIINRLYVV